MKHFCKRLGLIFCLCLIDSPLALAAFSNHNSVLLGDRAAGMGAAFTAVTGDPAAVIYYNPANMALMKGSSLSASVNVYHKYDSSFGEANSFEDTAKRINQGSFKSIPASSGSILSYGHFAVGLSIVVPDYNFFIGELRNDNDNVSTLQMLDQSLWVGVGFGKNWTERTSWGLSVYYTALDAQLNARDQSSLNGATDTRQWVEERSLTNNSLLYILGLSHQWNDRFRLGISYRLRPIEISGTGSYYSSQLDTTGPNDAATQVFEKAINTDQDIPTRLALGIAYQAGKAHLLSVDLVRYGSGSFVDFPGKSFARQTRYRTTHNLHLGYEYEVNSMMRLRSGIFTNRSAHYRPSDSTNVWEPEQVDMWGFSANAAIFTEENVSFTFGGYYTGGEGVAKQFIDGSYQVISAQRAVFSMLVSSAFFF